MSYILDALRKSAEERKRRQASQEVSYEPLSVDPRNLQKKRPASLLVLVTLLVVAAAGGWVLVSLQAPHDNPAREITQTPQQNRAAPGRDQDAPVPETIPETPLDPAPPETSELPRVVGKKQPRPADQPPRPSPVAESPTAKLESPALPLLQDLPFAQQAAIPEMKFSGHVYSSDPTLRLVMVNTAIVREGEMITPDIKLIEIVDNGLVLQYRGTRFKVDLF